MDTLLSNDYCGRRDTQCRQEVGKNKFSWSVLTNTAPSSSEAGFRIMLFCRPRLLLCCPYYCAVPLYYGCNDMCASKVY